MVLLWYYSISHDARGYRRLLHVNKHQVCDFRMDLIHSATAFDWTSTESTSQVKVLHQSCLVYIHSSLEGPHQGLWSKPNSEASVLSENSDCALKTQPTTIHSLSPFVHRGVTPTASDGVSQVPNVNQSVTNTRLTTGEQEPSQNGENSDLSSNYCLFYNLYNFWNLQEAKRQIHTQSDVQSFRKLWLFLFSAACADRKSAQPAAVALQRPHVRSGCADILAVDPLEDQEEETGSEPPANWVTDEAHSVCSV